MAKISKPDFSVGYVEPENPGVFLEFFTSEVERLLKDGVPLSLVGLVSGKSPAGAIAMEVVEDHLEVISLYVLPEYRRMGGSKLLLLTAESLAQKLDTWVSSSFNVVDENTRLLETAFLEAGFTRRDDDDEEKTYLVTLADCEESENLMNVKADPKLKFFRAMSENRLKRYAEQAFQRMAPMPAGGFLSPLLDRDLSVVYEGKNGTMGFLAVERMDYKNGIRIAAAYNGSENPRVLMWMLKAALGEAEKKYDRKTPIIIDVVDETADRYVRYILPEVVACSRIYDKLPDLR